MERTEHSQLELFSQAKEPPRPRASFSSSFISFIWAYEKTLLLLIAFIATGIIAFGFGMEKGKRIAVSKRAANFDLAKTPAATPKAAAIPKTIIPKPETKEVIQPKAPAAAMPISVEGYTIQVASYQTDTYAKKEAEALKKKGFTASVLPKGSHIIVCVGNFSDKDTAKPLLAELKKRYKDCYIRRL